MDLRLKTLLIVLLAATLAAVGGCAPNTATPAPMTPPSKGPLSPGTDADLKFEAVDDGQGALIVVYSERDTLISAQKVSPDGLRLWETNGVSLRSLPQKADPHFGVETYGRHIASDGRGGVYVAWEDHRSDERDLVWGSVYLQKVDGGGHPIWKEGGIPIEGGRMLQSAPQVAGDGSGGVFVVWSGFDAAAGNTYGLFAQRIRPDGTEAWATGGVQICSYVSDRNLAEFGPFSVGSDDDGFLAVGWIDSWNRAHPDVHVQKLDAQGRLVWDQEGLGMSDNTSAETWLRIVVDKGSVLLAWNEDNGAVLCQRLDRDGKTLWQQGGLRLADAPSASSLAVASQQDDGSLLVWQKQEAPLSAFTIGVLALDGEGNKPWDIVLDTGKKGPVLEEFRADIVGMKGEGYGGSIVAFNKADFRTGKGVLFVSQVSKSGTVAWSLGRTSALEERCVGRPRLVSDGSDGVFIIWAEGDGERAIDSLVAQRLGPSGTTVWKPGIIRIASQEEYNEKSANGGPRRITLRGFCIRFRATGDSSVS